MLYKLDNGTLQSAPKALQTEDGLTINPSDEQLLAAGWQPLEVDAEPDYDPATQYIEQYYEQGEGVIYQRWRVVDMPPQPEPEPTADELLDIILGVTGNE